jgi:colanic acid/amylovoran biosynthesis protein
VIKQVALCRVVVTGAYHAAVFALAQGIPVVGLAKSTYFVNKLLGLEDQFGEGCQTVFLNEPDLPRRLYNAIEIAWISADRNRGKLQTAAIRQIELSRRSYERIQDLAAGATNNDSRRFRVRETPPQQKSLAQNSDMSLRSSRSS